MKQNEYCKEEVSKKKTPKMGEERKGIVICDSLFCEVWDNTDTKSKQNNECTLGAGS